MLKLRFRGLSDGSSSQNDSETSQGSTLECVVEMLKGSTVLCRRKLAVRETALWLTPDLSQLKWRVTAKSGDKENEDFSMSLTRVRKLKVSHREISLLSLDDTKTLNFVMSSRERAAIWGKGLRCLIPEMSTGLVRRKRSRPVVPPYDPETDDYEGKPVADKRRLGELIVLGSIGRGAFGSVKLGLNVDNREFYAIKVLSKSMLRRYSRNTRLGRRSLGSNEAEDISELPEISVMRQLEHPNVVKMKEVIEDDEHDCLCIVTEYLPNGSVMNSAKLIGTKPLKERHAKEAFLDVLTGLHYLQTQGVVHRDIKPDNLLRAGDGTVKISDFGSSKKYADSEYEDVSDPYSSTVGTPAFSSPEMCISEKAPPKPSRAYPADLWSLGASLYYMVYGRVPFQARSVFEMYDVICTKPLRFPHRNELYPNFEHASQACEDVIQRLLVKDPEERATIEEIIKMPWIADAFDVKKKRTMLEKQLEEAALV